MEECFPSKLTGKRCSSADPASTMASQLTYDMYRRKTAFLRDTTSLQGKEVALGSQPRTSAGSQRKRTKMARNNEQESTDSEKETPRRYKNRNMSSNVRKHQLTANYLMAFRNSIPKYQWNGGNLIIRHRMSIDDGMSGIDLSRNTPFDLCVTLLSLLEKLCSSEAMNAAHRNTLSLFLSPQLTSLLVQIDKKCAGQASNMDYTWGPELLGALKRIILRIVLKMCLYSLTQHHKIGELSSSGLLISLLDEAKSSVEKILLTSSNERTHKKEDNAFDHDIDEAHEQDTSDSVFEGLTEEQRSHSQHSRSANANDINNANLVYIGEILQGILLLLSYVMYSCHDNQTVLTQGLAMLNEFVDSEGFQLFSLVIGAMDQQLSGGEDDGEKIKSIKESIIALISGVCKLTTATKKAKLEYLHKFQCLKRTHSSCDYSHYMHHHHGMFGMTHTAYEEDKHGELDSGHTGSTIPLDRSPLRANRSKCCIATVVDVILDLVSRVQCRVTLVRLLGLLEQGGICCCMPPHFIIGRLLNGIEERLPALSNYLLSVVAKLILEQLHGGEKAEALSLELCSECAQLESKQKLASNQDLTLADSRTSDSAIGSDGSLQDGDITKSRWQVLGLYANLLTSRVNEFLSVQVAKHLLHLVKHGNGFIKQELYLHVYLPCFEASRPISHEEDVLMSSANRLPYIITSPAVLEYCFSALPILLTSTFARDLFLSQGGLNQLLHLLQLQTTRPHILQVFEVIILSGDEVCLQKRDRERSNTEDSGLSAASSQTNLSSSTSQLRQYKRDHGSTVTSVLDAFTGIVQEVIPDDLLSVSGSSDGGSTQHSHGRPHDHSFDRLLSSYDIVDEPYESLHSGESILGTLQEGVPALPTFVSESRSTDSSQTDAVTPTRLLMPKDCISVLADVRLAMASDVWRTCANLVIYSPGFLEHFIQSCVASQIQKILNESLVALAQITKECEVLEIGLDSQMDTSRIYTDEELSKRDRFHITLSIVGSLMRIQLKLCKEAVAGRFEGESLQRVLGNVKRHLTEADLLGSGLGRGIADTLLKLAMLEPLDCSHYELCRLSRNNSREDGVDDVNWNLEELQEASDEQSSEQSDFGNTDGGYEADSERDNNDDTTASNKPDREDMIFAQSQQTLVYPQVCQMMLEVLSSSKGSSRKNVLYFLLNQLISMAKGSDACKACLNQCGVPTIILEGYRQTLQDSGTETAVERNLLLELFCELVENSITSSQLRGFLTLFQSPTPPLGGLLSMLLIIINSTTFQPTKYVSYPSIPDPSTYQNTPAASRMEQSGAPETNPWTASASQLHLKGNMSWHAPLSRGFGVALWLRTEERRKGEVPRGEKTLKRNKSRTRFLAHSSSVSSISSLVLPRNQQSASAPSRPGVKGRQPDLHLLTLGSPEMTFEIWLDSKTAKLVFRIGQYTNSSKSSIVAETVCMNMLTTGKWEHLAVTYQEKKDDAQMLGMITVVVNGHRRKDLMVDYGQSSLSAKVHPVNCLVGHCLTTNGQDTRLTGAWHLGHMQIFNDASALSQEGVFHLFSMGPDLYTLSPCEGSRHGHLYSRLINKDILIAGVKHDLLIGDREVDEKLMRESLVITYSASSPMTFSLYQTTSSTGTLSKVLPGKSVPPALLHCPTPVQIGSLADPILNQHLGLHKAVYELGGIGVFVYLFGKIVEMTTNGHLQAKALQLLLRLQDTSYETAQEFRSMSGPLMVSKVLATDRCHVGPEMLKVLFDACCSESVVFQCSLLHHYKVDEESTAILRDTEFFSHVLLNWRVWERASGGAWKILLGGILALIRQGHPFQVFNINQMQRVGLVQRLLTICRERHSEDLPALPADSYSSLIDILQTMVGIPPDPHLMAEISDFLLGVHPAVNTFVCHAPSSFYFILHKGKWYKSRSSTPSEVSSLDLDDSRRLDFKLGMPPSSRHDMRKKGSMPKSESPISEDNSEKDGASVLSSHVNRTTSEKDATSSMSENAEESERRVQSEKELGSSECGTDEPAIATGETIATGHEEESGEQSFVEESASATVKDEADGGHDPQEFLRPSDNSLDESSEIMDSSDEISSKASLSEESIISSGDEQKKESDDEEVEDADGEGVDDDHKELALEDEEQEEEKRERTDDNDNHTSAKQDEMDTVEKSSRKERTSKGVMPGVEEDDLHKRDEMESAGTSSRSKGSGTVREHRTLSGIFSAKQLDAIPEDEAITKPVEDKPSQPVSREDKSNLPTSDDSKAKAVAEESDGSPVTSSFDSLDASKRDTTMNQLCAGLLDLLAECLVFIPESRLDKVLGIVLKPETLVVMAHHHSEEIRTSVVKLLDVYFHRANEVQLGSFLRMQGFHLLANQLHQYPATAELAEACLTITFSKPVDLHEDLDLALVQDLPRFRQLSVVLICSLLENSIHDSQLCHNILCAILHLFEAGPQLVPTLLENGLLQTVTNTLAKLCTTSMEDLDLQSLRILLEDVQHLLACIGNRIFSLSGDQHFQHFEDMLAILGGLEEMFRKNYGPQSSACILVRDVQCHVMKEILEHFQSTSKAIQSNLLARPKAAHMHRSVSYSGRRYSANLEGLLRSRRSENPGKVGNKEGGLASEQELAWRFQRLCLLAVNLVVNTDPIQARPILTLSPCEDLCTVLAKDLFHLLTSAMGATMEKKLSVKRRQFDSIVWSSRQTLQLQLARLLVHMMSPAQDLELRIFTLQVAHIDRSRQILKCVLQTSMQQYASKLELFLYELLHNHPADMSETDRLFGGILADVLKECGFQSYRLQEDDPMALKSFQEDLSTSWTDLDITRVAWHRQRLEKASRLNSRMEEMAKEISNSAMEVTQVVSTHQNRQRLTFLEHIKQSMSSALDVRTAWQNLIEQLTHERAVWLDPKTYPHCWQLDPTEGPGRVRRRLQRCHLHIPPKFFMPEEQARHSPESCSRTLAYLFDSSSQSQSSLELKRRLQMNEKISHTAGCTHVTPATETRGELLLGKNGMYFVGEEPLRNIMYASLTQASVGEADIITVWWTYDEIKELHFRWYQLRDNALEIFLTNGNTLLLSFITSGERQDVYSRVRSHDLPNLIEMDSVLVVTQAWRLGQMTNFEYLTQLNKLAGRSFNDLMQYPIFPFILSEYVESQLDLTKRSTYRDLSKPVAVQSKKREERYVENFKALKEEYDKTNQLGEEHSTLVMAPYHYGSHYSNSGTVLQYLVRLPPFTQMFLHYQDNHFDLPDRTFHSIHTSWYLSSFQSTTDVKELIPEFFFLPEFLTNLQGFAFGDRQSGEQVHHVTLPPWARNNARLFIQVQKQALESDYVSQNLHNWVDLVFGFKQRGQPAIDAINVFHPATYFGLDTRGIKDPTRRRAIETMIKTYGQTPKQLFASPHQQRSEIETSIVLDSPAMGGSVPFLAQLTNRSIRRGSVSSDTTAFREPLSHVKGMRWGDYVGSPAVSEPMMRWQQAFVTSPTQLIPLPTGNVCGVAKNQCLLVMYSKERGVSSMHAVDIKWSGLLTWGHSDGILRLMYKTKTPPVNFLQSNTNDEITTCSSVSDCRLMFTGMASGIIIAYPIKFNQNKQSNIEVTRSVVRLMGHSGPVTRLVVCRPYSILVSASMDGTCIIWDLNRLCYVRSLTDETKRGGSITAVAVSDVSGEIASSSDIAAGVSELTLWSINAELIGRVPCHSRMMSLAFSNATEGISVNVVAAGCSDGVIRMWSTLDLTPVRNIALEMHRPITSLTFSHDSQFLFACDDDGLVIAWGKKDSNKRVPRFEAFLNSPRSIVAGASLEYSVASVKM